MSVFKIEHYENEKGYTVILKQNIDSGNDRKFIGAMIAEIETPRGTIKMPVNFEMKDVVSLGLAFENFESYAEKATNKIKQKIFEEQERQQKEIVIPGGPVPPFRHPKNPQHPFQHP